MGGGCSSLLRHVIRLLDTERVPFRHTPGVWLELAVSIPERERVDMGELSKAAV